MYMQFLSLNLELTKNIKSKHLVGTSFQQSSGPTNAFVQPRVLGTMRLLHS